MRSIRLSTAAVAAALLALAACGDDGSTTAPPDGDGDGDVLTVRGDDSLHWDRDTYEVEAGTIDIVLINAGNIPHTLLVEDADGDDLGIKLSVGRRDEGSIDLDAGQYVIWCDIPGHRAAGMVADLVVG